ncbi:hypothetical protein MMC17_000305 [Xylographa soralifera]|nr:hypothetical protein [Xylographa soralifera]
MPVFSTSTKVFGQDPPLSQCPEPIAICGMACRWPGSASNSSKLWDLLSEKRSGYAEFRENKLNLEGFYHPNQDRPGSMFTKGGYFLEEDPKEFDHTFFGITPVETLTMDPAQRKLLEVTYEAFENAGEKWSDFSGSNTGVFVGNFNYDHQLMQSHDVDHPLPYATTGGGITILSNRINYVFNLHGPSLTLDTACSSSMYALHLAVVSIRTGECRSAIVGGSNLILGPDAQLFSTKLGAISPTSTCHTFDAAADGYARADGFGVLYIKKLSDALANQDPIRAVIRGTAINANGRTGGISHPSPEGQEAVMRRAYESAGGLDLDLTGYFECHGTGTPVGDPLEVTAVGRLFSAGRQDERLLIGSIKPNLGHSESSSGIAGVMKAVLAIEHGLIPPTIGLVNPNPKIDFDLARVKVVTEMTPWPASKPIRRASVNSFGYGGANAHCILEGIESLVPGYKSYGQKALPDLTSKCSELTNNGYTKKALNGHTNGASNGHTNGASNGHSNGASNRHVNGISNGHVNGVSNGHVYVNGFSDGDSIGQKQGNSSGSTTPASAASSELFVHIDHDTVEGYHKDVGSRRLVLLPFSGHDEHSLKGNIAAIAQVAEEYNTADLAYTLGARRSIFFHRAYAVADPHSLGAALEVSSMSIGKTAGSQAQSVAFIFTGQGAQWAGMGAELFAEFSIYRESIALMDAALRRLPDPPTWTLKSALLETAPTSRIQEPEFSQPLCTALQVALVDLLSSWNIKPVATVGHSSGEIAAAYAAGYHTAEVAIILAFYRGKVVSHNKRRGSMLAVGLGSDEVATYLEGFAEEVVIAAINSPESVTLSGEADAIDQIKEKLDQHKVFARHVKTGNNAYHSHHMASLGEEYERLTQRALDRLSRKMVDHSNRHTATWISSVTPHKTISLDTLSPKYWRKNLESPVRFGPAVQCMARQLNGGIDVLVEVGPHSALAGPLRQIRAQLELEEGIKLAPCLASIVRGGDALRNTLDLAGNLFLKNVPVDLKTVNAVETNWNGKMKFSHGTILVDLPNYKFHYAKPIIYENRYNKEWRLRKHLRHDILGARQPGCAKGRPAWRNMLRLRDVPWLDDHKLLPHPVFPAAGYLTMAVEAMSQIFQETANASEIAGFTFRSVAINSTLQVPDDEFGVETILNMQAVTLTTSKISEKWYEFKISSVMSDAWTEHCHGTICAETVRQDRESEFVIHDESKTVDSAGWYDCFSTVGLGYGPTFQGLTKIRADPRETRATATVALHSTRDSVKGGESPYPLHPATLDTCLQLALIACHAGQIENVRKAFVPIVVDNLSIWVPQPEDEIAEYGYGQASGELRGLRGAYGRTQLFGQSGRTLMDLKELRCVSYDGSSGSSNTESVRSPYLRLVWKPDISSMTRDQADELFPPTTDARKLRPIFEKSDKLSAYIIVQFFRLNCNLLDKTNPQHLQMFLAWIQRCVKSAEAGTLPYGREALHSTSGERATVIRELSDELGDIVEVKLVKRIYDNLPKIFTNETSGLQVALQDNLLNELYVSGIGISGGYPQFVRIIDLIAHKNPTMKVIEVGGGTGGATRLLMNTLGGRTQYKRYKQYCFTDVTTSFLSAAEEEFADCTGLVYDTLDIEKDPTDQGFNDDYDLVVASQVLHATTIITETIRNTRRLLTPGGKMVLLELTRVHLGTGLVLGTLPDYWKGVEDGRLDSPLLTKSQWDEVLQHNGFSGIDILLNDHHGDISMASVIVTTAVEPQIPRLIEPRTRPSIILVHRTKATKLSSSIASLAQKKGIDVSYSSLVGATIPNSARVIVLADLEGVTLPSIVEAEFEGLKEVFRKASSLLWVSRGGLIAGTDANSALMVGLMRSITTESAQTRLLCIDLEPGFENNGSTTAEIVLSKEIALQNTDKALSFDGEYVQRNGLLHVSRLMPDKPLNQRFLEQEGLTKATKGVSLESQHALGLGFDQPGLLSSLFFKEDPEFYSPLKDDWVEIETKAVGLNVKDLAVATGRFDWNKFSTECSGIVTKVGDGVENLKVGDKVFGGAPGNFGNFVRVLNTSVQKMKPDDSFEGAATMPVAYMTAIYAFNHLARLSHGETVLIQSATGGLGMAALRLARHIGAEIYATVGTPEKVKLLMDEFGIAADHIFSSRELSTPAKIKAATHGRGIDVILCSAAGEQMHETWKCIAPMGRFIEVGRTDILDHGKLSLDVFNRNATFSSFDLGLLNRQKPEFVAKLMAELGDLHRKGVIRPIDYIKTFDISQLEQAMMYFAKGTHLGKVVITFKNPKAIIQVRPTATRVTFDSSATYLLVGCLGGLGRSISMWMAERGARNLVYLSRSGADKPEAARLLEALRKLGVVAEIIRCNITVQREVKAAVQQIQSPIRGVIQAAMVVDDALFDNMTLKQFKSVVDPKVAGTVNLHEATLKHKLDFFTMTSSIVTMMGPATEGSYCAANAFQDSFARYRASMGLPGQAIALGMILEVGFVSHRPEVQKQLLRNGVYGTNELDFLKIFEASFVEQSVDPDWQYDSLAKGHLLTGLEPLKLVELYKKGLAAEFTWHTDARFGNLLQAIEDLSSSQSKSNKADSSSIGERLKNASPAEARVVVTEAIVERLAKLLFTPSDEIDPSKAVSEYGMDSMIAAELRNWFVKTFQTDVSFLELLNPQTKIRMLVDKVFEEQEKLKGSG